MTDVEVTPQTGPALLVLEDGTAFRGRAIGAAGTVLGEAVFNTGMAGYQEVLSDPSYRRQIVTMTAPHVGNYGMNAADMESDRLQVAGFVVREAARRPSSFRALATARAAADRAIPRGPGAGCRQGLADRPPLARRVGIGQPPVPPPSRPRRPSSARSESSGALGSKSGIARAGAGRAGARREAPRGRPDRPRPRGPGEIAAAEEHAGGVGNEPGQLLAVRSAGKQAHELGKPGRPAGPRGGRERSRPRACGRISRRGHGGCTG